MYCGGVLYTLKHEKDSKNSFLDAQTIIKRLLKEHMAKLKATTADQSSTIKIPRRPVEE